MRKPVIWLIGLLAAATLVTSEARADRRVALVVGNSGYLHAGTLRNPRNDAADVAEMLKKVGFEVLLGLDLDQQQFASKIEQFARALDDADVGLFYYAGHGLQLNEKNYLVSINAKLESEFLISAETIELDTVIRLMESKAPTNLVFLDACRSNPLAENLKRNLTALRRGGSLGRGLARVEPTGRDTLIAFAAAPGHEAADGIDRNSPFTAALLKHLPQPGVEVSVMLKEVSAEVRRETRNAQRPQQLSDMARTFYFTQASQTAAVATAPAIPAPPTNQDDRAIDLAFWNAVQSANDCETARAYLQRFPNGAFVDLAKLAERRLCGQGRRVSVLEAPPPAASPAAAGPATSPEIAQGAVTSGPVVPPTAVAVAPATAPVASPPPAAAPESDLARKVQLELIRVGCSKAEADGRWGPSSQAALRRFVHFAKLKLDSDEPTAGVITALGEHDKRVCPLECAAGFRARGDSCIAVEPEPATKHRKVRREPQRETVRTVRDVAGPLRPMRRPEFGAKPAFIAPCRVDLGYGRYEKC